MTLDLITKTPRSCVCCELSLGQDAQMGVCRVCAQSLRASHSPYRGGHLWCSLHDRVVTKVPELR